ncbi:MAG TPA: site-specific DNA-methyltransferase, partial [Solirubrobacteraceae bacterium]|nr:site-specific DNA-methyltransferase [Solirubrobacteraceae bacterium]
MDDGTSKILLGDNIEVLPGLADASFQLIYIDPPFNTGKAQSRKTLQTEKHASGDRIGFGGRRYATRLIAESSYRDAFDDYLAFLEPRLIEAHRLLNSTGTLYFHIDYREAHYCKILLDEIFGRDNFLNEIIWAYDYGARSKKRWPAKHDTILVYVKDASQYYFDAEEVDREPYMAPGLVTPEKV